MTMIGAPLGRGRLANSRAKLLADSRAATAAAGRISRQARVRAY
jgi:hypothetical protein